MKTPKNDILTIHEKFVPYMTKALDSKYRITLGNRLVKLFNKQMDIEGYKIFVSKTGDILLKPTVSIPSNEAWVYNNPQVMTKIRKGLEESRTGKTEKVDDIDSFLENL
jgi:hypothetical protein